MFGNAHRFTPLMTGEPASVDVSVKIRYGDSLVRVGTRHLSDDWATFVDRLRSLTGQPFEGIENGHPTRLTYTDDEGDVITVRTSWELLEAYRCQRGIRKFNVERVSLATSQPPQPPRTLAEQMIALHNIELAPSQKKGVECIQPSCPVQAPEPVDVPKKCKSQKKGKMNPNQKLLHLFRSGRLRKADTFFQKHGEAGEFNNNYVFLYNGACLYTRLNRLQYAAKLLERSVLAGYRDISNLMSDTDLNELRRTPEFDTIVQLLRALTAETPRPAEVPTEQPKSPITPVTATEQPIAHETSPPAAVAVDIVEVVVEETPEEAPEEKTKPAEPEEPFVYQSTLNTLLAMGIDDSLVLRQIVTEERGNLANVIDRILM